jgi:DNA-binding HxlR family transcriptional regulator
MKRDALQSLNCRSKSSKYDLEIDKTIIEILDDLNINKKSGEVRDQLERLLGRAISPDTYNAHLNNLIKEGIMIKDDKGRGKEIVYSLSEYGRKLKKLKLLKTDKDQELFREKYVSLFFYSILDDEGYFSNDLSQILKDIGASSKDLKIERIEEVGDPNTWHTVSVINKILHFNVIIHYKAIRNVRIEETTNYNETIFRD